MKVLGLLIGALAIGLPAAHAQDRQQAQPHASEIHPTDLVGTWVGELVDSTGTTLPAQERREWANDTMWFSVWPDSTFQWLVSFKGIPRRVTMLVDQTSNNRWHRLTGNNLAFSQNVGDSGYNLKLDGRKLTMMSLRKYGDPEQHIYLAFTRVDTQPRVDPGFPNGLTGKALPCNHGMIQSFACENVELLAYLPRASIGKSAGYDLWGWHDSTTGREFLLIGGKATAFVEVTDPVHPMYLGVLPPPAGAEEHAAQSVKVYQHYAFVAYEGANAGIQIFDLTQLRDTKSPKTFQETAHYSGVTNTHTLALNQETGFAYVNGSSTCGGGLHMLDVRTPTNPTFVGCYSESQAGRLKTGRVHDAQCVVYRGPDTKYAGREICMNYAEIGISIADVTDKKNPKTISIATYPDVGYTHQGWFTEDQRYIFVDDEFDEGNMASRVGEDSVHTRTIGFDLTNLDDPIVLTEFYNSKTNSTDHNLYIRGRYMYQGNYNAGLRIIDVADPKHPKEVGYLTNIAAAWGTYPFLKNGVVAVSSTFGLFLARLKKR